MAAAQPRQELEAITSSWGLRRAAAQILAGRRHRRVVSGGQEHRPNRVAAPAGATTSTVCVSGTRALAKSRCVSRGAGATTVGASEVEVRILSRETFGVGGTIAALNAGDVRLVLVEISGAGAMTFIAGAFIDRLADELNSGEGATTLIAGKVGAVRDERKPSAGGGPGFALKASRLATAESECGRLTLGASTTFSTALSPRATRIACVRWWACCPPARPVFPACAPPRSFVRGSSSPE